MRVFSQVVAVFLVFSCAGALAEDVKPPLEIPAFPGSEITMEINLASEDIPVMLQTLLPLVGDSMGGVAKLVTPEELADALSGIQRVEVLDVEVRHSKTTLEEITAFYGKNLPSGEWRRVLYISDAKSSTSVYADPTSQNYYGFRVRAKAEGSRTIKEALAARVCGSLDVSRVISLLGKVMQSKLASAQ